MKATYNNFTGLSPHSERIGTPGSYYEGNDVDPYRSPGYLRPGWVRSTRIASSDGVLTGLIKDMVVDPDNTQEAYGADGAKLYQFTNMPAQTITDSGATGYPHTVSGADELCFYYIGANRRLIYLTDTSGGMVNVSGTAFDDDWLSTVPRNATALQNAPHPKLEWPGDGILYIGNGRYLASLDGQTGTSGELTEDALTLPYGWEITTLFPTQTHIGIGAWKKVGTDSERTESAVFLWNTVSAKPNYKIPIEDNYIKSSINDNGTVFLITKGRSFGSTLRRLTSTGAERIRNLKVGIGANTRYFYVNNPNNLDLFQNRLLIGASAISRGSAIFAYGKTEPEFPVSLVQPYSNPETIVASKGEVGMVRHMYLGSIYASFYDGGTKYYLDRYAGSASAEALYRGLYTEPERECQIKYVKFYFKPLVSGDSITVSLDINHGTSMPLGTISYAKDGAATSKKFVKPIKCYNFRPVIDWTAGSTAFSKIVVEYNLISD